MSIYTTPVSRLTAPELQELLDDRAVENVQLEFKSEAPNKDDTLKKLSSFANTFGGLVIVGAKAKSTDGRIEGLAGVDPQAGYKQKLVQWCSDGVSPPITIDVSDPIEVLSGHRKVCYVIRVAESDVAPHFINGRGGIWIRTNEFSSRFEPRLANEIELRHLLDRRRLVIEHRANLLERARQRLDAHLSRFHTDRGGHPTKSGSGLKFCVVPRFPSRPLCDQTRMMNLVEETGLRWRGTRFPATRGGIFSQHESVIVLQPTLVLSMLELNIWGMAFYATKIDDTIDGLEGIHLYNFAGNVMLFLRHSATVLRALGYFGPIQIDVKLTAILRVPWIYNKRGVVPNTASELDSDVGFSVETDSETLYNKTGQIAMTVLEKVMFAVNAPDLVDSQDKLTELVELANSYNRM